MTSSPLHTDRVYGERPRTAQELPVETAGGLLALVISRLDSDWLADEFPERCSDADKRHVYATNVDAFEKRAAAVVPNLSVPLWRNQGQIGDDTLFDLLEFVGQYVAEPRQSSYHKFFDHFSLHFDRQAGAMRYRDDVNQLLSRGGVAYEMRGNLKIFRRGPAELREALDALNPATGDTELDALVEEGRRLFASRKAPDRLAGIQSLWGALERLKTVEQPGKNQKKASAEALLAHIDSEPLRDVVRADMLAVTDLGNTFRVRHHETHIANLPVDAYDYFAGRVVTVLHILLRQSGRLVP